MKASSDSHTKPYPPTHIPCHNPQESLQAGQEKLPLPCSSISKLELLFSSISAVFVYVTQRKEAAFSLQTLGGLKKQSARNENILYQVALQSGQRAQPACCLSPIWPGLNSVTHCLPGTGAHWLPAQEKGLCSRPRRDKTWSHLHGLGREMLTARATAGRVWQRAGQGKSYQCGPPPSLPPPYCMYDYTQSALIIHIDGHGKSH